MDRQYVAWLEGEIGAKAGNEVWAREELDRYLAEQQRLESERPEREREAAELAGREKRAEELAKERLPLDYFPKLYAEACSFMAVSMIGHPDPSRHPLALHPDAPRRAHDLWARIDRDLADDPGGILSAKANIKTKLLDREASRREAGADVAAGIEEMRRTRRGRWTGDGRPYCIDLSRIVGRRVSAAERDRAWRAAR